MLLSKILVCKELSYLSYCVPIYRRNGLMGGEAVALWGHMMEGLTLLSCRTSISIVSIPLPPDFPLETFPSHVKPYGSFGDSDPILSSTGNES